MALPLDVDTLVYRLQSLGAPKAPEFFKSSWLFELNYIEYFAGVANVWRAISNEYPAVYPFGWWMGMYGAPTPKRHKGFSNSKWAAAFNLGKLKAKAFRAQQDPDQKSTVRYEDKNGNMRWKGSSKLKSTQVYPVRFGHRAVRLMPRLKTRGEGMPKHPPGPKEGPLIFEQMGWDSEVDWSDARMTPVLVYLRGNASLKLPQRWREVFPTHV
ncbi:unnamed protein product [Durusdinium trenchii]|uniref:Uncharacterized protein n=1 Tax=Durusdinium trenchii TaxID=1381693 RepID=A0ABP0JVQ7_9DINO